MPIAAPISMVSDPSQRTPFGETPQVESHHPEVIVSRVDPTADVLPRTWADEEDNRPRNRDDDYSTDSDVDAPEVSIDVNGPWGDWRTYPERYWQTVTFRDNALTLLDNTEPVTVSMVEQYIRRMWRTIPESDHGVHVYWY